MKEKRFFVNSSGIGVCYTVTKELLCTKIYKTWERLVFTMEEIKTVQIGQITLAYKEFGSGDKYLLSTQNFFLTDCHMELLGKPPYDYHCFLVYMRGYGKSTHITDNVERDYNEIWGEDLLAFAKAMGIKSFYYTGVSHGNFAGWYAAFNHPEVLKGFVCCDGIVQYRQPEKGGSPSSRRNPDADKVVGNYELLEKMAWMEPWPTQNPERLARRAANHKEHTAILMERAKEEFEVPNIGDMTCCRANSEQEMLEKLAGIHVPVLIWLGGLDPLATAENALKVAQVIPGASLLTYQHLGHGGSDEFPEMAARDCDRFFRDTENRLL